MTKPVTIEDIIYFLDRQYYGKMGRAYRVTFRKSSQKPEWDFIQVEPQQRESYDYLGISWKDWQRSYVKPIIDDITSALDKKFGKGLNVSVTEKGFVEIMGFNNMGIVPSRNANLKNLTKRVADRQEKEAGKIEGKFKEVSPVIGAWFESLMIKLDSIQKVLGYAEQIAQKESDKADKDFERVYGKYENLSDEELDELYEDENSKGYRLMRKMQWADEFLAAVSSGKGQNSLQKAIRDAKNALGNWIHDSSNPYRETQRRASIESRIAEKYLTASRTVELYMPSGEYKETQELETELEKELGFIPSDYTVVYVAQMERWTELVRVKYKR